MTFTFYSNFLNQIQKPFCDEMHRHLGDNFKFVSTLETPEIRLKSGYPDYSEVSYNILAYKGGDYKEEAKKLSMSSDIVMFGSNSFSFVKRRISDNLVTINCTERIFKKSDLMKFNPRIMRFMYLHHTKFRNKNLHLLCASAFLANDVKWIKAYPNKTYKWGYFTKIENLDTKALIQKKKKNNKIEIIWVARFIDWKHPELMVGLAKNLKDKNYNFQIKMIGGGTIFEDVKELIKNEKLEGYVSLIGNIPNDKVLNEMRSSDIFCITSDRNEGWGAVLNEAMSNGCAVVASSDIGAVPYLINPNKNGLVFTSKKVDSLTVEVEKLINNEKLRHEVSKAAYETMKNNWSPAIAADSLIKLSIGLLEKRVILQDSGPCSRATPTPKFWHKSKD